MGGIRCWTPKEILHAHFGRKTERPPDGWDGEAILVEHEPFARSTLQGEINDQGRRCAAQDRSISWQVAPTLVRHERRRRARYCRRTAQPHHGEGGRERTSHCRWGR